MKTQQIITGKGPITIELSDDGKDVLNPEVIVCEECGNPATVYVRDVIEYHPMEHSFKKFEPDFMVHLFCNKHERKSERIDGGRTLNGRPYIPGVTQSW